MPGLNAKKAVSAAWWLARQGAFALKPLARQLAGAANRFSFLARLLFRRLFIEVAQLHFTKYSFALHLLLQRPERLIDVIIANQYLHAFYPILVMSVFLSAKMSSLHSPNAPSSSG